MGSASEVEVGRVRMGGHSQRMAGQGQAQGVARQGSNRLLMEQLSTVPAPRADPVAPC